jgi:hypothetical protein
MVRNHRLLTENRRCIDMKTQGREDLTFGLEMNWTFCRNDDAGLAGYYRNNPSPAVAD